MADFEQSGAVDVSIAVNSGIQQRVPFPYSYNYTNSYLTRGIIYNGYLWILVYRDTSTTTYNVVGYIYRIALDDPSSTWELMDSSFPHTYSGYTISALIAGTSGNKFYVCGAEYGPDTNQQYGLTTVFDVTNPSGSWSSSGITDLVSGNSGSLGHLGCVVEDSTYINSIFGNYTGYCVDRFVRINKSSLTGSWAFTSSAGICFGSAVVIVYANEIYFLGGLLAAISSGDYTNVPAYGGTWYQRSADHYNTNTVRKYSPTSNTWISSGVMPDVPGAVEVTGASYLVGSILYLMRQTSSVYHYYDMSLGASGSWVSIPIPPFVMGQYSSLSYDPSSRKLYVIDANGYLHWLQLGADNKPVQGTLWDGAILGKVNVIDMTNYANCDFPLAFFSNDTFIASVPNSAFDMQSAGWQISSYTATQTVFMDMLIDSTCSGLLGACAYSTDTPISIGCYGDELGTSCNFSFAVESSGTAVVYREAVQSGTVRIAIPIESDGSLTLGATGSGASSIEFVTKAYANTTVVQSTTTNIIIDVSSTSEGISDTNGVSSGTYFTIGSDSRGNMFIHNEIVYPDPTIDAWSLNTNTGGVSCYTRYAFNSIFKLNGKTYATSDKGLTEFGAETDDGYLINADVLTGITDFDINKKKNISDNYVYLRSDKGVVFHLTTDEQKSRKGHVINSDEREGLHRRRAKSAKGIKGSAWQIGISNRKGGYMDVNSIECDVTGLNRGI